MAGAWRSLRYDMGRRPFEPPAGGPDVTSTGMSTFAGTLRDHEPRYDGPVTEMPIAGRLPAPRRRSPRHAVAFSAFGLLTVVGAAGVYLVVVNGLVPIRDEGPAAAATVPPTAEAGLGRSPRTPRTAAVVPARTAPEVTTEPPERVAAAPRPLRTASPVRTTNKPAAPVVCCANPPVPTPTAPPSSPSPTPSAPASPSAGTSGSGGSGGPGNDPSDSPEPRNSQKPGHHRRHH
jgi:hypothetical protein